MLNLKHFSYGENLVKNLYISRQVFFALRSLYFYLLAFSIFFYKNELFNENEQKRKIVSTLSVINYRAEIGINSDRIEFFIKKYTGLFYF